MILIKLLTKIPEMFQSMSPGGASGLDKLGKNKLFIEKSHLATPDDFLSVIFGFLRKFLIDIGG